MNVSYSTVCRAASKGKFPLKYKAVAKKPALTQTQVKKQLAFAMKYKGRDWHSVVFTDSKIWNYKGYGGPT